MSVKLADTIYLHFGTTDATTGAATDADSLPSCVVEEDGVAMGYAPTVTNIATGLYRITCVCTGVNGFEAGKRYSVYVVAAVGGITGRDSVAEFLVEARYVDDVAVAGDAMTLTSTALDSIVDGVLDESLAAHNISQSLAKYIKGLSSMVMLDGTAAGGGSNYIDFDTGASTTNKLYEGELVAITGGTGAGQARMIVEYIGGGTKRAYVQRPWVTNPNAASTYTIIAVSGPLRTQDGLAQAGGASTIRLSATASAQDNIYIGEKVVLFSGTGEGQARIITAYNGTTKDATVNEPWLIQPDATTTYAVYPLGRVYVTKIRDGVVDSSAAPLLANLDAAVSSRAVPGDSMALTGAAVDAILDEIVEGTYTVRHYLRLMAAALLGKLSGGGTATLTFRNTGDSIDRIITTIDVNNNRTVVVLDET